ncbi:MAG: type II secretion system protein [Gammaproteobacteria bacterium]|nr:MAG: type II secretion system protein [Gammaproteobacteria bacterium]
MDIRKQPGFTLIELVLVITILGILAAFAVPRFISISADARLATVNSLAGSLRSAAALAHSVALVQAAGASSSISVDGATVTMVQHYPAGTADGIVAALQDLTGFTSSASAGIVTFQVKGVATPASCQVQYTQASGTGGAPTITVTASTSGCS